MPNVNFQCSHCGMFMAIGDDLVGRQVRCPHCKLVVVAPASTSLCSTSPTLVSPPLEASLLPAAPNLSVPGEFSVTDQDSIFAPADADSALFGGDPKPMLEMPTEPLMQPAANPGPCPAADQSHARALDVTIAYEEASLSVAANQDFEVVASAGTTAGRPAPGPRPSPTPIRPETAPMPVLTPVAAQGFARPAAPSRLILALILIPLISYCVLATVAVLILYFRPPPPDPLEQLLDLEGDFKGATRQKQGSSSYERVRPDRELPARLRVALGQSLNVGDVEVSPLRVELRRVTFLVPGFQPEKGADDSLVLYLRFRNTSPDLVFCPTDPFFERRWKPTYSQANKPYTFLELAGLRIYGGPSAWGGGAPRLGRESIEGQAHKHLKPKEELTTFVCTDPEDHVGKLLLKHRGSLVWRIQVRRGLLRVRDHDVPVTAVVGVEFDPEAIHQSQG